MKKLLLMILALILTINLVSADEGGCMMNMFGYGNLGWFGIILWIVFWIAIIWIIIWLIRESTTKKQEESPLGILKRRYANGEISKKQYDEMRKNL